MPAPTLPDSRTAVLLSAHDEELIGRDAAAISKYIERIVGLADPTGAVAATLLRLRPIRRHRAVVRAADRRELTAALQSLASGRHHPLVCRSSESAAPRTAFVFPGQGNQWPSMGAEAYHRLSAYRAEADRCAKAFAAAALPSPLRYLLSSAQQKWTQTEIQGAQFIHAVSLAQVWQFCGILPDIAVGHSLGEVAAAYVAGTITLPDSVAVVAARATAVERLTGSYGMAVAGIGVDDAKQFIAETRGWLEVSAVNAPSSTVISGDRDAVAGIVRLIGQRGIFARELAVDYPGHTSAFDPLRRTFQALLPASTFRDGPVEFIGSAFGTVIRPGTPFRTYWYDNLRNTVRFDEAVAAAVQRGARAFIELSAHPSLTQVLEDLAGDALILCSGHRNESAVDDLSANIAAAAVANPQYRWADVAAVGDHRPLPGFPNAPMRSIHLWAKREPLPPLPGTAVTVAGEHWQRADSARAAETGACRGVAIVGPGVTNTRFTRRLTEAIAAHSGTRLAAPEQAQITVVIAPALTRSDTPVATDDLISRLGAGLGDYTALVGPKCRNVWLITAGGEHVQSSDPVASPAQAALAAMHRSVGFEFGDQSFGHLDLPSWELDAEAALTCVDVLLGHSGEVALRDSGSRQLRRYARVLCECGESTPERPLIAAELDNVVITGGNGTIGLRYARHCVEQGARKVILLSRRAVDRTRLDRLVDGHAADVHAPACDITDAEALAAVAAQYADDGASLLIHAAGTARFGPHNRLTEADLAQVLAAKVTGLARMVECWPLRHGVRLLLCSSVSGVWGGRGHAAYSASNRMLDVLADQLRSRGLDCTAVRWGLWQDTKIAAPDEIASVERSGLVAMDPDAALSASLRYHAGDPLIFAADSDRLRVCLESQGTSMHFAADAKVPEHDAVNDGCEERSVAALVRTELAATLGVGGPASVDLSAPLVDLGVDSMLALDLRTRLRHGTGRIVALGRLLGGITGAELIDALETPERLESSRD
ncbi:MAG: mycobactin polyketide synthase MbtD [Mycobacterium sp.]|nr:mycobactin polyketide synthase MbtD [Mycobacterium sp.]